MGKAGCGERPPQCSARVHASLITIKAISRSNGWPMTMLRRSLALLLAVTLVLAWAGPSAFAGVVKACTDIAATTSASDGCKGCGDGSEQRQPSCPGAACIGICAAAPAAAIATDTAFAWPQSASRAGTAPPTDIAFARPIRPDLPPPR